MASKRKAPAVKRTSAKQRAPARRTSAKQTSRRKLVGKLSSNAVIAALVGALAAGIAGYLIANHQDQDAASQARASQQAQTADQRAARQAQAATQLRTEAEALYASATAVYSFQRGCAKGKATWQDCASIAPSRSEYVRDANAFISDIYSITDQPAINLATQFSSEAADAIIAETPAAGKGHWSAMLNAYLELLARCAHLANGQ